MCSNHARDLRDIMVPPPVIMAILFDSICAIPMVAYMKWSFVDGRVQAEDGSSCRANLNAS